MDSAVQALELGGVLLGGGAWLCSLATTLMTSWLTQSTDLLPTESYQMGLWETCVVQELGGLECRPYDSLLGLPPDIRLARILMVLTLGAGLLGLLLAIPGLHAISCCSEPNTHCHKRALKGVGGALGLVAGVVALVPVSYVAHLAVLRFFDESVPDVVPRWEFGDALFCGWAGAVLHLGGGAMLIASCLYLQRETCQRPMTVQTALNAIPLLRMSPGPPYLKNQHQSRTKMEYV